MPLFKKFDECVHQLGLGDMKLLEDEFVVYLTNSKPNRSNKRHEELPAIEQGFGYHNTSLNNLKYDVIDGVGIWEADDVGWEATGQVGPFRYAVIYNDFIADNLVGWADYGEEITLFNGNYFRVDLSSGIFKIQ